jgi:tape measure domain-containing protein
MEAGKVTVRLELDDKGFQQKLQADTRTLQELAPKATGTATALRELAGATDRLATVADRMETTLVANTAAIREMGKRAEDTTPKVASLTQRLGDFGSKAGEVGRSLTMGVTLPLVAFAGAAVKSAVDMESLRRGLTAVTGSSAAMEVQMVRLREVSKLPGLGFEEAVKGSIRLQAAGISAETAEKALRGFGNALATIGAGREELGGVIRALSQIQSKGTVQAEEINQLAERLPQIRTVMKEAFGTSNTEALQGMGISSEEFISKITDALAKLPPAATGAKESFEELADTAKISLAKVGEAILPAANKLAKELAPAIEKVADGFRAMPDAAQQGILIGGAVVAAVGPAVLALGSLANTIVNVRTLLLSLRATQAAGAATGALSDFAGVGGAAVTAGRAASAGPIGVAIAAALALRAGGEGLKSAGIIPKDMPLSAADAVVGTGSKLLGRFFPGKPVGGAMSVKGNGADFGPTRPQTSFVRDTSKADAKQAKFLDAAGGGQFATQMQGASNASLMAAPGSQAQREAALALPIITARRQELQQAAEALKPLIKEDAESAKKYWAFQREDASLQGSAIKLQQDAAREVAENRKKTEAEAKKTADLQKQQVENVQRFRANAFREQLAGAEASAAARSEEGRTMGRLEEVVPVLETRQRELMAEAKSLEPLVSSSWDAALRRQEVMTEVANLERQKQQAHRSALEEHDRAEKKAADEAKRTAEKMKQNAGRLATAYKEISDQVMAGFQKMNSERLEFPNLVAQVEAAKAKNNPFLNDRQRAAAPLRAMERQLFETLRPVQGESVMDGGRRQLAAEGIKSQVIEALGGFGRMGRRGALMLNQQFGALEVQAQNTPVTSRAVTEAQALARDAATQAGKPVVMQMFLNGAAMSEKALMDFFREAMRRANTESGLAGAAGY